MLVLDEAELVDQRSNRCLNALDELDVAPPGCEPRRLFYLVELFVDDPTYCREGLHRLAVSQARLGRVVDQPVISLQPLEPGRLAVACLGESALYAQ